MFRIVMLYAFQLVTRIHEPESIDRKILATGCSAALLSIQASAIHWPSLGSKAWQPLQDS